MLDDNRLLTMPSGERIQFGPNVNFLFETHDLSCASPATISRMGMIFLRSVHGKTYFDKNFLTFGKLSTDNCKYINNIKKFENFCVAANENHSLLQGRMKFV